MSAQITAGYVPGAIGRIAELHGTYYAEHWGFDLYFEAKVATELAAFLGRYDRRRDGFWVATLDGRVEGSLTVDAVHADTEEGAHLRWFIVSDRLRGTGVGARLVERAVAHCRACGYQHAYLWTFAGLDAARHLYEKSGFRLAEQRSGAQWGTQVEEQRFAVEL